MNAVDGFPPASGAHPMFVTSPYAYATTGGLTVMPPEAYQQALQQQVSLYICYILYESHVFMQLGMHPT